MFRDGHFPFLTSCLCEPELVVKGDILESQTAPRRFLGEVNPPPGSSPTRTVLEVTLVEERGKKMNNGKYMLQQISFRRGRLFFKPFCRTLSRHRGGVHPTRLI